MRYRGLLIGLLILAVLLIDVVSMFAISPWFLEFAWPSYWLAVFLAFLFSQNGLLAVWVGLGCTALPWRIIIGFLGVLFFSSGFVQYKRAWTEENLWLFGTQTILILVVLVTSRFAGWHLQVIGNVEISSYEKSGRFQFTLWTILVWTTTLAVALGLLRSLALLGFFRSLPNLIDWDDTLFGMFQAPLPLSALWAFTGRKWPVLRAIQLLLVLIILLGITVWIAGDSSRVPIAVMFTFETLFLAGALYVVRLEGFRLTRRHTPKAEITNESGNPSPGDQR
jgi:hypothetical protein